VLTTIAGSIQALVSFLLLRRRIGGGGARRVLPAFVQYVIAVVPSAAAGFGLVLAFGGLHEGGFAVASKLGAAASMVVIGLAMAVVYFGVLVLLRNRELLNFATAVRGRLGR
ncbi:MAG: murein biosynthesis integral membrane protein MurJ, partial [Rhodoglobus sp.]